MSLFTVRVQVGIVLREQASSEPDAVRVHAQLIFTELLRLADAECQPASEQDTYDYVIQTEAPSPTTAVLDATSTLRAAAQAAGAFTPEWPLATDWDMWITEREVQASPSVRMYDGHDVLSPAAPG